MLIRTPRAKNALYEVDEHGFRRSIGQLDDPHIEVLIQVRMKDERWYTVETFWEGRYDPDLQSPPVVPKHVLIAVGSAYDADEARSVISCEVVDPPPGARPAVDTAY